MTWAGGRAVYGHCRSLVNSASRVFNAGGINMLYKMKHSCCKHFFKYIVFAVLTCICVPAALQAAAAPSPFESEGKWGFVGKSGKFVISPEYDAVRPFSEGLAAFLLDGKWGFLKKDGKRAVKNVGSSPK